MRQSTTSLPPPPASLEPNLEERRQPGTLPTGQLGLKALHVSGRAVLHGARFTVGPLPGVPASRDRHGRGLDVMVRGGAGDSADELTEAVDLFEDHLAHLVDVVNDLEVEVEGGGAVWLVGWVVPDSQVRVGKGLLDRDAAARVEGEHAVQQIKGVWVGVGEERGERLLGHVGQVAHVLLGAGRADARERLLVRGTQDVQDLVELVDVVAALEERPASEQLGKNTTDRPDIDYGQLARRADTKYARRWEIRTRFGVVLEAEHDLGRAVPPRRDILSHVPSILLRVDREAARQAKIANLELAIGIDEQVARLQVAVQHVGRVDILEAAQDLVDEGLEVGIGKRLAGADNGSQIAFHELCRVYASAAESAVGRESDLGRTLVEISLIKVVGPGNVHVVQASDLGTGDFESVNDFYQN
jgi:hypothetical protein